MKSLLVVSGLIVAFLAGNVGVGADLWVLCRPPEPEFHYAKGMRSRKKAGRIRVPAGATGKAPKNRYYYFSGPAPGEYAEEYVASWVRIT